MKSRILYVDDEPDIREIAVLSLELDPDLEVRACETGRDAVEMAAEWRPDLLLLDVMMPDMDGPQTLLELRNMVGMEDLPVVFITARAQHKDVDELLALGAVGVIAKPFDPMKLSATVREFLPR